MKELRPETIDMLKALAAEHNVRDPMGEALLDRLGEAFERMQEAQALVDEHGLLIDGRANPAVKMEHDARAQYLRTLKALELQSTHHSQRRPKRGAPVRVA